ncbi:MAG TPA: hypothetical protein VGF89_01135 [Steroidobacteraceae bacterium]
MSEKLKDFRGKITPEIYVALEAESRVSGRTHSEIAREVLHRWALEKLHISSVVEGLAAAEGIGGRARDRSPGGR